MYRGGLGVSTAEIQRLTVEEATLMNEVAVEQTRWSDLNRRLEEIALMLARSQQSRSRPARPGADTNPNVK
jgi:hypothetical protein